jgi:hypothetical protein
VTARRLGKSRLTRNLGLFLVIASLAALLSWPLAAAASDHKGQMPYQGLLWMSRRFGYDGTLWVTTNSCNGAQRTAFNDVRSSTAGIDYMARWANGINMSEERCDGYYSLWDDIQIVYKDQAYFRQPDGSYIGGRNVDLGNDPNFCAFWNTWSPCGQRPQVQINTDKYYANDWYYRRREIMHETGHANGLLEHCSSVAIMNNGSSGCYGGLWNISLNYRPTDRLGISETYP